ncbi:MAG: hypothetical protein ACI9R3_003414 [Verrucomicrobiales bacterium]|jgi:hypothetical protein
MLLEARDDHLEIAAAFWTAVPLAAVLNRIGEDTRLRLVKRKRSH